MVTDWGMSDRIGPIRYSPSEETAPWGGEFMSPKEHSDDTSHEIDMEVQRIISESYEAARSLLQHNHEALQRIADALLKKEVLSADEVRREIEGLPIVKPPVAGDAGIMPAP
jgi:cell division protease FtsH